ncbi:hypothetical protein EOG18_14880 [Salmonella enterica]|nr:hypothetical protein [Salmonella enterica]
MKSFSQGPKSRFDFGVAIVVLVLMIVLIYVHPLWKSFRWESVCQHQHSGKLDPTPEKQIQILCETYRKRNNQVR